MRRMYSKKQLEEQIDSNAMEIAKQAIQDDKDAIESGTIQNVVGVDSDGEWVKSDSLNIASVKANEIIENMSGYSYSPFTKTNMTLESIYAGAVKNGNKLSLVIFAKFTRTGEIANDFATLGKFVIPKSVGDKIIPTTIGSITNAVLSKNVLLFNSPSSSASSNVLVAKGTESSTKDNLTIYLYNVNGKTLDTTYQLRLEMTFLLSDNMLI